MNVTLVRLRYNIEAVAKWPPYRSLIRHMARQIREYWEGSMYPGQYQKTQRIHLLRHTNRWVPAYERKLDDAIHSEECAAKIIRCLPFISEI